MKVLHLSTDDRRGGAALAAYRLHNGLRQLQVDSIMMVQRKTSADNTVVGRAGWLGRATQTVRWSLDSLPLWRYGTLRSPVFSAACLNGFAASRTIRIRPDILHLHWTQRGFVSITDIALMRKPIVWTLHDMWAFTGGCHYSSGCRRYVSRCGSCPLLRSPNQDDLSSKILRKKLRAWSNLSLTVVAPSHWLADCARQSSILGRFPTYVIPNGLDTKTFARRPIVEARRHLGLPESGYIVLFGAVNATDDRRKGFAELCSAIAQITAKRPDLKFTLAVFGAESPRTKPDFGVSCKYLGLINDETDLANAYAAADVFVAPSLEDNLPNTVAEALACGVPCVAFRVGGIPDLVQHRISGYLATPHDSEDLAYGIQWVLDNDNRRKTLGEKARAAAVRELDHKVAARRYEDLYMHILK